MNVALHLNNMGQDVTLVSKVGNDEQGRKLTDFLQSHDAATDLIEIDESLPTSEVLVHLDANNNATYEICEPVAWDRLSLTEQVIKKAKNAGLIIYGTLAARDPQSRQTILKLIDNDAIKLIDVNLRKPHDTREIVEMMMQKSDIIKLNDDELVEIAKWHNKNNQNEEELVKWLAETFHSLLVCVTKGEKGALLYAEGKFYSHPGFIVNAIDTVGAGDAFLAGLVSAILEGKTYADALVMACATGAFVATKAGATPKYDIDEINAILSVSV